MPAIEVNHLTKEHRLGAMRGLKQTPLNASARLTRRHFRRAESHLADGI